MTSKTLVPIGTPLGAELGFSRAVKAGNMVFVSGTTASGDAVPENAAEQTRVILERIGAALQAAGASLADVVDTKVYLTSIEDWRDVGAVHGAVFKDVMPASTFVQVGPLISPALKVEISATALCAA